MRFLLVGIFGLICTSTNAMTLELFGIAPSGKKALLAEGDNSLDAQNNGLPVFVGPPNYGYCTLSSGESSNEYYVACSPEIGGPVTIKYKSNERDKSSPQYKASLRIYKKHFPYVQLENQSRDFGGYYLCVKDCTRDIAKLLVKVIYRD